MKNDWIPFNVFMRTYRANDEGITFLGDWKFIGDTLAKSEQHAINNVRHREFGDNTSQHKPLTINGSYESHWEWKAESKITEKKTEEVKEHMKARINIEALEKAIKEKGTNKSRVSAQICSSVSYLNTTIKTGYLPKEVVEDLESVIGIMPDVYVLEWVDDGKKKDNSHSVRSPKIRGEVADRLNEYLQNHKETKLIDFTEQAIACFLNILDGDYICFRLTDETKNLFKVLGVTTGERREYAQRRLKEAMKEDLERVKTVLIGGSEK